MKRRGLLSQLYRTARLANDVSAITSGNPHRIARRAKNRVVGRAWPARGSGACSGATERSCGHREWGRTVN
jgi:hypothetical protein